MNILCRQRKAVVLVRCRRQVRIVTYGVRFAGGLSSLKADWAGSFEVLGRTRKQVQRPDVALILNCVWRYYAWNGPMDMLFRRLNQIVGTAFFWWRKYCSVDPSPHDVLVAKEPECQLNVIYRCLKLALFYLGRHPYIGANQLKGPTKMMSIFLR